MTKRKHRLYLDITFNLKLSTRDAAKVAQAMLDNSDIATKPVSFTDQNFYVDKADVVEIKGQKP